MKYVRYLQEKGIEHKFIGWDREGKNPVLPNSVMWKEQAGYNVGGFQAVKKRIGWMRFVYNQLCKSNSKDLILHGCDIDSAFPAAVFKSSHRKVKLIFDVFDWFSATLYEQNRYILTAFKFMEKYTSRRADKIILCEPERIEQIPYHIPESKLEILPNIPFFDDISFLKTNDSKEFENDLITFSYVGGFVTSRCLFELVEIAEKGIINLKIAGFGEKNLEERLLKDSKNFPNIKYYGKVKYEDGLNISLNSDVMYAMYSTINPNHVYAAPNKFYEAMFLGKPIFTTIGTIVEKKVLNRNIGFVSGETLEEIIDVIKSITTQDLKQKSECSKRNWIEHFQYYTRNYLEKQYLKF